MKKYLYLTLFALLGVACSESEELSSSANIGEGCFRIEIDTQSIVDNSYSRSDNSNELQTYTIPSDLIPTEADFKIIIKGTYIDPDDQEEKEIERSYSSLSQYNTAGDSGLMPPSLPAGDYTISINNGNDINTESATNAYFAAEAEYTLVARDTETVVELTASLKNSIVRLTATEDFTKYLAGGATLTLSTTKGTTLKYTSPDNSENEDKILFVAPETTLYLEGEGIKQDPGNGNPATVTFTKSEIGTTKEGYMTSVSVDAEGIGSTSGITVTLPDSMVEIEEEIDVQIQI